MAITKKELAQGLERIYNDYSNKEGLSPQQSRKKIAEAQADLIANFVIGRSTVVTGTSATGGVVNAKGIIQ